MKSSRAHIFAGGGAHLPRAVTCKPAESWQVKGRGIFLLPEGAFWHGEFDPAEIP